MPTLEIETRAAAKLAAVGVVEYAPGALAFREGVLEPDALKVTAAGGQAVAVAAGTAVVLGDDAANQDTYLARPPAGATTVPLDAAHGTLPRLDQIVLRVADPTFTAASALGVYVERRTGTPTAGVTLDSRAGAAALPPTAILLSDVLVPAGSATVLAGNVRDRRPFARGTRASAATTGDTAGLGSAYQQYPGLDVTIEVAAGQVVDVTSNVNIESAGGGNINTVLISLTLGDGTVVYNVANGAGSLGPGQAVSARAHVLSVLRRTVSAAEAGRVRVQTFATSGTSSPAGGVGRGNSATPGSMHVTVTNS